MTDARTALRLAVYYRALASVAFLLGGAIALVGLWVGLGEAVILLLSGMGGADALSDAFETANLPLAIGFFVVGVLVWQVGRAAAFYWTLARSKEIECGE